MVENSSVAQKHTSGEAPKVCSVCTITWSRPSQPRVRRSSRPSQSPQRDVTRGYSRYGVRRTSRYERLPQANQAAQCCP